MIYVIDSDSLINLFKHYYFDNFPTLWTKFDLLKNADRIISVREVLNEVKDYKDNLSNWAKKNHSFFPSPSDKEQKFVKQMFQISGFQSMIREQARLKGKPVADPFVIASAKFRKGCVITEEVPRPSGAKIPNVCTHFKIKCVNLQQFMKNEKWIF